MTESSAIKKAMRPSAVSTGPEVAILIIDDEASLRTALRLVLQQHGYKVIECDSKSQALEHLAGSAIDIVLCDINLVGCDGLELLAELRRSCVQLEIVAMTGFGSPDMAVAALRAGASDYLSKPFAMDELISTLRKLEQRITDGRSRTPTAVTPKVEGDSLGSLIANSEVMRQVFRTVERLSDYNTTVLITGESGTGKELLARAIHNNSLRKTKPFVAVNCGAIPESLVESELFGHKKGAFTDATRDKRGYFEEAEGGTVFLDEVGELPTHMQAKLLRALQERQIRRVGDDQPMPIDVRVVAATLRDLEDDVIEGRFRDDLFYRLNVVNIHIPPLRERSEDIPVLVEHFLKKHLKRLDLAPKTVSGEALQALVAHSWKGNVRELENVIERAVVLSDGAQIELADLPQHVQSSNKAANLESDPQLDDNDLSLKRRIKAVEVALIRRALERTKGNRTKAAKELDISHRTLLYKLKEYKISS